MSMSSNNSSSVPAFCQEIQYLGEKWPDFDKSAAQPMIAEGQSTIQSSHDDSSVYQTLLAADAVALSHPSSNGFKGQWPSGWICLEC